MSEVVADGQDGLWLTMFKGVNLLTAIVDTDYDNWAVFVQCMQEGGKNRLVTPSSTSIMATITLSLQISVHQDNVSPAKSCSRTWSAGQGDNKGKDVLKTDDNNNNDDDQAGDMEGDYKYKIDQENC